MLDSVRPVLHSDFKERIITSRHLTYRVGARKRHAAFFGPAEAYVPLNNAASNERDSAHARDAPTAVKLARARFFLSFFLRRIAHRERSAFTGRVGNIWRTAFRHPSLRHPFSTLLPSTSAPFPSGA